MRNVPSTDRSLNAQTWIVRNGSFGISMIFTVAFFLQWGDGSFFWSIVFVAAGIIVDLTKKNELDLSCVATSDKEYRKHRFFAFILTLVSLFISLSAALSRASIVELKESSSAVISSRDLIEADKNRLAVIDAKLARIPDNWLTERRDLDSERSKIVTRLAAYQTSLESQMALSENEDEESMYLMLESLADFFKVPQAKRKNFMVFIFMAAMAILEMAFWSTMKRHTPQVIKPIPVQETRENFPVSRPAFVEKEVVPPAKEQPKPTIKTAQAVEKKQAPERVGEAVPTFPQKPAKSPVSDSLF